MSPELKKFLTEWYAWATAEPHVDLHKVFHLDWGLCDSYWVWRIKVIGKPGDALELVEMFKADGLDTSYPFGEEAYERGEMTLTMHKDVNRLSWVKGRIDG